MCALRRCGAANFATDVVVGMGTIVSPAVTIVVFGVRSLSGTHHVTHNSRTNSPTTAKTNQNLHTNTPTPKVTGFQTLSTQVLRLLQLQRLETGLVMAAFRQTTSHPQQPAIVTWQINIRNPLSTENLLEDTDGLLRLFNTPADSSASSRCGSLLLSSTADVRSLDDVITFEGDESER